MQAAEDAAKRAEEESRKAQQAEKLLNEIYDTSAGELFKADVHAEAFRRFVTGDDVLPHLPKDQQRNLAKGILEYIPKAYATKAGKPAEVTEDRIIKACNHFFNVFKKNSETWLDTLEKEAEEAYGSLKKPEEKPKTKKEIEQAKRQKAIESIIKKAAIVEKSARNTYQSLLSLQELREDQQITRVVNTTYTAMARQLKDLADLIDRFQTPLEKPKLKVLEGVEL